MHMSFRTAKVVATLGAVLAALTGVSAAALSAATTGSPWSQTDYNSAQSRANLTEQTLTSATVSKVRYLRSLVTPLNLPREQGCLANTFVAPVLTGGSIYAVANGRLTKYNAATGSLIWRRIPAVDGDSNLGYRALSVAGGLVVVGVLSCGSVSDPGGHIQAFNASTGVLVWSKPMPAGGALAAMGVAGSYVVAAGTSIGSGEVVSVRQLATGALVWYRATENCGQFGVLVVAQLVMSYRCDHGAKEMTANKLTTGTPAWSLTGGWKLQRGDSAAGHHLYATSPSGAVVGLDPLTGKTQYTLAGAARVLAVDTTRAYAYCGALGVCAYSTATGSRRWSAQPGSAPAMAAEAGGVLYLANGRALNTGTGQTIISLWTGKATALVIGDGRVAVVTDPRVLDLYGLPGS